MKFKIFILAIIVLFGLFLGKVVHAQSEQITLSMSRDFGYSSGSGKIQGLFSMKVSSAEILSEVDFYIDSTLIIADKEEPYKVQFNTDDYPVGTHIIYAVGVTKNGDQIKTNEVKVLFVSAEESRKAALGILIPVFGLVLLITLIAVVIPAVTARKKGELPPGASRNYGIAGGTICSRCKRPFSLHMLAPNMLLGKLERCPHCGKWGIFRPFPSEKLHEAEQAELVKDIDSLSNHGLNAEEQLKKDVDDSRFQV